MQKEDIYTSILKYMCENYDYTLYATDFNAKHVNSLQRAIASLPSVAGQSRIQVVKIALQDFFNAIYQRIFIYEDEERIKLVKYFDTGAINEEQDRTIHTLRQELVKYKTDVEDAFEENAIFMFDKNSRNQLQEIVISLEDKSTKDILRKQISLVYELEKRDVIIFLNECIFIKKFNYEKELSLEIDSDILIDDSRFSANFLEVLQHKLHHLFKQSFLFFHQDKKTFYKSYPNKFKRLIEHLVEISFLDIDEVQSQKYAKYAYKKFLPYMLKQSVIYLLDKVVINDLKAISFLKSYSESINTTNNTIRIKKQPLIDKEGHIYNFQGILKVLKKKEALFTKIGHKRMEIATTTQRVKKSLSVVHKSEDEMNALLKRRLELLHVIEKVDNEIEELKYSEHFNSIDLNRLEFSKRDLLEVFKQVEIRIKRQNNILDNSQRELHKWENKRNDGDIAKADLEKEYVQIYSQYQKICEALSFAFAKEPIDL